MKLDTQGSEYDILSGGLITIKDVIAIDIEVEFSEMYKNQKLFSNIDEILRNNGFEFFTFLGNYGSAQRRTTKPLSYSKNQYFHPH